VSPRAGSCRDFVMSPVRLERVTEANSGDLQTYAAERVALEEGGPLLVEAVTNPDAYLDHVRRFAEGIDLPSNRVPGFEYCSARSHPARSALLFWDSQARTIPTIPLLSTESCWPVARRSRSTAFPRPGTAAASPTPGSGSALLGSSPRKPAVQQGAAADESQRPSVVPGYCLALHLADSLEGRMRCGSQRSADPLGGSNFLRVHGPRVAWRLSEIGWPA